MAIAPPTAYAAYSVAETVQFTTTDNYTYANPGLTLERSPETTDPQDLAQATDAPSQANPELEPELDPELGNLRLQPIPVPDLTSPQIQDNAGDSELGILRLQESPIPEQPTENSRRESSFPSVYLLGGANFLRSDNIFSSQVDPVGDSLFVPGLSIYAQPQIAPDTYLVASVGGYLVRYVDFPEVDYNELRFRVGIRQILSPQMYGEVNWTNTQLFDSEEGDRFLDDHALRLLLVRSDAIAPDLSLDSFYQLRVGLANPEDRSRISNSLGLALVYDITPDLEAALDYQVSLTTFTEQDRDDFYNELVLELAYDLSSSTQISAYGGFSFGESTRSDINFNSGIFGIGINFALPLF